MWTNVIIVAIDELLHPVIKGLDTWGFLVASIALTGSLSVGEFFLHLLPLCPTLFSLSSRMMSIVAHLLGCILENFFGIGPLPIDRTKPRYLHDAVEQDCYFIATPICITFPRHVCEPNYLAALGQDSTISRAIKQVIFHS